MKNKVIFESEEEVNKFLKDCVTPDLHNYVKNQIKQKGYIRESIVEEAEKVIKEWLMIAHNDTLSVEFKTVVKLYAAIQHMKPYYEKAIKEARR